MSLKTEPWAEVLVLAQQIATDHIGSSPISEKGEGKHLMHAILIGEGHERHVHANVALVCNEGVAVLHYPNRFVGRASGEMFFGCFKQFCLL